MKKAIVLINVGTPNSPSTREVRKYLHEFLNDPAVIDLPPLQRKLLVNLIIVPFRSPRSAKKYAQIWQKEGSPLLIHMNMLVRELSKVSSEDTDVYGVMRYGNPSLESLLEHLFEQDYEELCFFPLYPQYASSTTGSVLKMIHKFAGEGNKPRIKIIEEYYSNEDYLEVYKEHIFKSQPHLFDHVVFSYHGLPNRQVQKAHPEIEFESCSCEVEMPVHGKKCYRASCYHTSRLLAQKLKLKEGAYTTAFQSRLSKNWMTPFTDKVLEGLAVKGIKNVLVIPASFSTDCLETLLEIDEEYKQIFLAAGGESYEMVPGLNASPSWAKVILKICNSENS